MDSITQLFVTKSGYDAIAVFVDILTKMVHFTPTYMDCSARDVARLLATLSLNITDCLQNLFWIEIPGSHLSSGQS
jgi:hypothetical protein